MGGQAHAILDGFSPGDLLVIQRFIAAMADSVHSQVQSLEGGPPSAD